MPTMLGPPVAEKDGYTVHRLYALSAQGDYEQIGFGLFSPDGELMSVFASRAEAEEALDDITEGPRTPRPR